MATELLFPAPAAEAPAVEVDGRAVTHADLAARVGAWRDRLERAGVREGDRVAIRTEPTLEAAAALVVTAAAGAVVVPLAPSLGTHELAHVIADAAPRALVAHAPPSGWPAHVPHLDPAEAAVARDVVAPSRGVDDRPLLVLYTSGTTGAPKGAVLTARNVASNLDALAAAWAWTSRDVVVHALPLFHVHGLVLGLYGSVRRGGTLAWRPRFEPAAVAARLAADDAGRPKVLFAVPTMIGRLVDAAARDPAVAGGLARARLLVSGSAGLPAREHRRVEAIVGRPVRERYGLTETLIVTAVREDDPVAPGSVGRPLPGVEVRLVDDDGAALPDERQRDGETIGEVAVRGPGVFAGYLNQPAATAAVLGADGWFRTGDLARRDADGRVWLVGRRSTDLVKCGGFKVGAGEVEAALLEHPDVAEAAVVGAPDADLGERIVAYVVAREGAAPTAEALVAHVAGWLAPHKRPREVHFVSALPRNAMGKVQKRRLGTMVDAGGASLPREVSAVSARVTEKLE